MDLNRRMAFEELAKSLQANRGVKADVKYLVCVANQLQEFLGVIHLENDEAPSLAWDHSPAFDMTRLHKSMDHLAGELPKTWDCFLVGN